VYDSIMVPLDGSTFAESALPLALALARRTGATLHLVTVVEPMPPLAYEDWEADATEWVREYLDNTVERVSAHHDGEVTMALERGDVVDILEAQAVERKADVVVMATHGRGMFSRMWLGSVADGFLHRTDRPIIMVRPEEDREPPALDREPSFRRLLVPLDGSDLSESALEHATEFGELFDASYHLVRMVAYPHDLASPYVPHTTQMNQSILREATKSAEEYLEVRAERMRHRGLQVTTSVTVDAQAGHGILVEAVSTECDAIAMATHGRTGVSRAILGSSADKVLRGTHLPLLLYRPTGIPG
jgi:nucleotide-binding universal stress UspA family protein